MVLPDGKKVKVKKGDMICFDAKTNLVSIQQRGKGGLLDPLFFDIAGLDSKFFLGSQELDKSIFFNIAHLISQIIGARKIEKVDCHGKNILAYKFC